MPEDTQGMKFIADFFVDYPSGFVVDVGAEFGVGYGSMSAALIENGWCGLMVEPLPEVFIKLNKAYRDNPNVQCVNVACSDEDGKGLLFPFGSVSTLNREWADACAKYWEHIKYRTPITVDKYRLSTLLKQYECPVVDFLQIDTEGHDLQVLCGMDWAHKPSLVCIETLDMTNLTRNRGTHWEVNPEIDAFMVALGYELVLSTNGGNGFYVRKD